METKLRFYKKIKLIVNNLQNCVAVAEGSAPTKKGRLQKVKSANGKPIKKFKPGEAGGKLGPGKKVNPIAKDGKVVKKWKPGGKDGKLGNKWKPRSKADEKSKTRPKETAQSRKQRKLKRYIH